jgi:hypothetical protein
LLRGISAHVISEGHISIGYKEAEIRSAIISEFSRQYLEKAKETDYSSIHFEEPKAIHKEMELEK